MELYEASLQGPKVRSDPAPGLTEVDLTTSLLMGISEQLQQIAHYTAQAKGRPKIKRLPRPKTARDLYERRKAREAFEHLESVIKFVPREEFERTIGRG